MHKEVESTTNHLKKCTMDLCIKLKLLDFPTYIGRFVLNSRRFHLQNNSQKSTRRPRPCFFLFASFSPTGLWIDVCAKTCPISAHLRTHVHVPASVPHPLASHALWLLELENALACRLMKAAVTKHPACPYALPCSLPGAEETWQVLVTHYERLSKRNRKKVRSRAW